MSNMFLNIFLIELQVFTKKTTYFYGTPGANRTRDLWLRRPTLYPLSYGRRKTAVRILIFFVMRRLLSSWQSYRLFTKYAMPMR